MPNTPLGFPFPDTASPFTPSSDIQGLAESVDDQFQLGLQDVQTFRYVGNGVFNPDTTPPSPDFKYVIFYIRGAGGGGAGAGTTAAGEASSGGGGGEGMLLIAYVPRSDFDGNDVTITCGVGGSGGSGNNAGGSGGLSFISGGGISTSTASGGSGGSSSLSVSGIGHGAGGRGGGITTINFVGWRGADGTNGIVQSGQIMSIGHGAPGVRPLTSASGQDGSSASFHQFGYGGSGAFNYPSQGASRTGGAGASGAIWAVVVY